MKSAPANKNPSAAANKIRTLRPKIRTKTIMTLRPKSLDDVLGDPGVARTVWDFLFPPSIMSVPPNLCERRYLRFDPPELLRELRDTDLAGAASPRARRGGYLLFKALCLVSRTWRKRTLFHLEMIQHEKISEMRWDRPSEELRHSVTLSATGLSTISSTFVGCYRSICDFSPNKFKAVFSRRGQDGRRIAYQSGWDEYLKPQSIRLPRTLRDALQSKWTDVVDLANSVNSASVTGSGVRDGSQALSSSSAAPVSISVFNDLEDTEEIIRVRRIVREFKSEDNVLRSRTDVYWQCHHSRRWIQLGSGRIIAKTDRKLLKLDRSRWVCRARLAVDRCAEFWTKLFVLLDFRRPEWNTFEDPPIVFTTWTLTPLPPPAPPDDRPDTDIQCGPAHTPGMQ